MSGRKIIILVLILSLAATGLIMPAFAEPLDEQFDTEEIIAPVKPDSGLFDFKAKGYALLEASTGKVLLESSSHERLPIASVTKIMSMLLIMEAVDLGKLGFEDMVPVSEHAFGMGGSQVYLKPGEEFTLNEMLKAIAIHSANDATVAVAELISGSEPAFVEMMNEKARALGMKDTNFLDCTGLTDEGHYSSAHDIGLMSRELIFKHPKILEYTGIWMDSFRDGKFELTNTNRLVRFYQGANGLKTGFTNKAGYCLSATATRNKLQLISVVLGEPDSNTRFEESKKLLDFGFANYEFLKVNSKGERVGEVMVKKGLKSIVNAIYGDDVSLITEKSSKGKITREIRLDDGLVAPIAEGQKIGEVIYRIEDREIGRAEAVASTKVEKATFIKLFIKMTLCWFALKKA